MLSAVSAAFDDAISSDLGGTTGTKDQRNTRHRLALAWPINFESQKGLISRLQKWDQEAPDAQSNCPSSLFSTMKIDRDARSAWKVALRRALCLEIAERVPEWPRKAHKAVNRRNFARSLRQKRPFGRQNATLDSGAWADRTAELDVVVRMGRKVASRKALVELYKRLPMEELRSIAHPAARGVERTKNEVDCRHPVSKKICSLASSSEKRPCAG
ncbi:hypothetical protein THAOC_15417, partial [Thalassiosira oceanica]